MADGYKLFDPSSIGFDEYIDRVATVRWGDPFAMGFPWYRFAHRFSDRDPFFDGFCDL